MLVETREVFALSCPKMADFEHGDGLYDSAKLNFDLAQASATALAIGLAASVLCKSPLPITVTAIVAAAMVASYRVSIRSVSQ